MWTWIIVETGVRIHLRPSNPLPKKLFFLSSQVTMSVVNIASSSIPISHPAGRLKWLLRSFCLLSSEMRDSPYPNFGFDLPVYLAPRSNVYNHFTGRKQRERGGSMFIHRRVGNLLCHPSSVVLLRLVIINISGGRPDHSVSAANQR